MALCILLKVLNHPQPLLENKEGSRFMLKFNMLLQNRVWCTNLTPSNKRLLINGNSPSHLGGARGGYFGTLYFTKNKWTHLGSNLIERKYFYCFWKLLALLCYWLFRASNFAIKDSIDSRAFGIDKEKICFSKQF